ncbi:hypothetical protein GCM10027447_16880 [Glycomyces halotolerans]
MVQPPNYGPPPPGGRPPEPHGEPDPRPHGGPGPEGAGGEPAWYGQGDYQQPFAPPPKRGGGRTGLIIGIVIAVVLLLAAAVAAFLMLSGDDEEPSAIETTTAEAEETTGAEEETTGPPPIAEAVGACLPQEPTLRDNTFDLTTTCESDEAFWTVTAADDSVEATVDEEGRLDDLQAAYDVCGEEYGRFAIGEPWTDWYFTYDSATGSVEELLCVEALGNPDEQGRLPITPDTGDCFDDSDTWWSVPCDSEPALYEVADTIEFDQPRDLSAEEAEEASSDCSSGELFWQITDVEGLTTALLCGDER